MIELPRAALRAGQIAETAEFFSFGTNDLTQTTFGLSRDDSASFLPAYQRNGILGARPVRDFGHSRRRRADPDRTERGPRHRRRSSSATAANMAATPPRSASASRSGWITCPARLTRPIARLAAAQAALFITDEKAPHRHDSL